MNSVASKHAFKDVTRNATTGRATWRSIQRVSVPIRKKTVDPPCLRGQHPTPQRTARPPTHLSSCWCTSLGSVLVYIYSVACTCTFRVKLVYRLAAVAVRKQQELCLRARLQYARFHQSCFVPPSRTQPWTHGAVKPKRASHVRGNSLPQLPTRVCEQTIVFCFSCTSLRQKRAAHAPRSAASCFETNLPLLEKTSERVGAWLKSIS